MADNTITLLSGVTSSAVPTTLTDATLGVAMPFACDQAAILVHSTAGSGTMTATVRLWGFFTGAGRWYPLGNGTNQGYLNAGSAMSEVSTKADTLAQAEMVSGLRRCSRLYAEIVGALGGTSTAITVLADCVKADPVTTS